MTYKHVNSWFTEKIALKHMKTSLLLTAASVLCQMLPQTPVYRYKKDSCCTRFMYLFYIDIFMYLFTLQSLFLWN